MLYLQVMRKVVRMVLLLKNSNSIHRFHWNIVLVELEDDVASLNVHANDVDSSSNWLMMVAVEELENE